MKKIKKIPYTPKYKIGGIFSKEERSIFNPDADDKKKMKKFGKQAGTAAYGVGEGLLDTVTMGATDQLTDKGYTALQKAGNSTEDEMREQNSIRGFGNAAGAIGGAIINPGATGAAISQTGKGLGAGVSEGNKSKDWSQGAGMALTTAGKVGSMAYGMSGSPMTPGMEAQAGNFNSSSFGQGLGKYNEFMGQGNPAGGMQGSEEAMGGMGSPLGIMNMLSGMGGMGAGAEMPINKYGGYMKYAMGGMQYANGGTGEMNAEVEGGGYGQDGENAVAPGGEFTQFKGATHAQGGIKTDMAPGTKVFSDKLKAPGTNKTFAKLNASNNTNREDKLDTKEYLDPKSKMSIDLTRMAKMKNSDMLFAMQEQLKKDKVAAYAKRMGVELPSMDNEQMEPQGMPEQAEGEMAMVRYGGMMNRMAMGGVQLPYYNTNNDGTPKYAMGGMGVDPAMPATNTGTVASTPPQFNNRMEFDKYYQSQGFAKDPRNKLGSNVTYYNPNKYKYDQGTDSFKFANNEPVPYNSLPSSDLMEFKPESGVQKVVNKKVLIGQQSLNKWDFNSGIPTKKYYNESGELLKSEEYDNAGPSGKVLNTIEPRRKLAYGGKLPKYEYGIRVPIGPEDPNAPVEMIPSQIYNPYGGVPNAPVFNPSRYGQGQYDPNDLQLKGNTTITETPDDALSTFRKQNSSTSDTENTTGTGGGNNNRDMILQGLGMVAGIAPKAAYLKEQGKNYDTQQFYGYDPSLMDPTQARKDEQYAGRQNQENIRIGSMGSGATLLTNAAAQRNKTSANLGRINKEYENANVGITNRGKEYNIGNRYAVDDINARNKGAALSNYYKTLDSAGAEVKQGTKDIRGGNQDKQMMAMIPKMMNNPEFKKFFEEYQKGQVG